MKIPILTIMTGLLGLCFLASCAYMPDVGKILPDKKSEYKKSKSMPDLEVPPDLTADAMNDSMNIPNEAPVTLSSYKSPRTPGTAPAATGSPVLTETAGTNEQALSLSVPASEVWPALLEFLEERYYSVELEDSDLGVIETDWSQVYEQAGLQYRYKYKIFAEPGATPNASVLIISQQRQSRVDDTAGWVDQDKDPRLERQFAVALNSFIGVEAPAPEARATASAADETAAAATGTGPAAAALRVVDAGEGKMYLNIPEAFEQAWKNTGIALQNSGLQVTGGDPAKGFYLIKGGPGQPGEKKGLFSRLAFWKGDKSDQSYQINLTGVGNQTELIVVNKDDEWEATDDAARILALIRDRYPVN